VRPGPDDAAYLMYTSGSTGRPKCVRVDHRNLANVVAAFAGELGLSPADATLWSTTPTFDISLLELFLPLTTGGRVVVAGAVTDAGVEELLDAVVKHDVRVVQATPTVWRLVIPAAGDRLRDVTALCGGEPLTADLAAELLRRASRVYNAYGPTETTIWSTLAEITRADEDPVPIGRPIANTTVFLTSRHGDELGFGVAGELCVAGAGVSAGYPRRPDLTAERFGERPGYGRFYRTGDLARWRSDGLLECLGRLDRQVKLRGQRIEPGEVESALREHEYVADAAVTVVGDPQRDGILRAFARPTPAAPAEGLPDLLWRHLRRTLPAALLPSGIVIVDRFPSTVNGKLDHQALAGLAVPVEAAAVAAAGGPGADPELVASLTDLWRESLSRADLGPDDNFFLNGGHSLLATRLSARVADLIGRPIPLRMVFDLPTAREMASALSDEGDADDHV
jgi:acyl-coenzyme A synthetase/AMP-(fatty) acid ligase